VTKGECNPHKRMSALIGLEKDEKQGNPDPGLQYLREINLTAEEEANYTSQCRGWVPGKRDPKVYPPGLREAACAKKMRPVRVDTGFLERETRPRN